jgi:hypothetical protein
MRKLVSILTTSEGRARLQDRGGRTDNPNWPTCCLRKNSQRRIDAAGLGYTTITMHPGVVIDLGRNLRGIDNYEKLKSGKVICNKSVSSVE